MSFITNVLDSFGPSASRKTSAQVHHHRPSFIDVGFLIISSQLTGERKENISQLSCSFFKWLSFPTQIEQKTQPNGVTDLLEGALVSCPSSSYKHPVVSVFYGLDESASHTNKYLPHLICHPATRKNKRVILCNMKSFQRVNHCELDLLFCHIIIRGHNNNHPGVNLLQERQDVFGDFCQSNKGRTTSYLNVSLDFKNKRF